MPATEQLNITISTTTADSLRDRIASGDYASASEFVEAALMHELEAAADLPDGPELENWLQTVGVARYDAYDANQSDVYSSDDVRRAVAERRAALDKA